MITLTDAAIARVRNLQSQRATSAPLRLGIKQGGCSGLSYLMDILLVRDWIIFTGVYC